MQLTLKKLANRVNNGTIIFEKTEVNESLVTMIENLIPLPLVYGTHDKNDVFHVVAGHKVINAALAVDAIKNPRIEVTFIDVRNTEINIDGCY